MPKVDPALWRDMLEYLRQRHGPICRQWFEQLQPLDLSGGLLKIHTDNAVQQTYLQKKCRQPFMEAAQAATGALVGVKFVNKWEEPAPRSAESDRIQGPGPLARVAAGTATAVGAPGPGRGSPASTATASTVDLEGTELVISPDNSFDQFVVGPGNQMAHAASIAVANRPGTAYNPLFIHGGVGLGKTHLLQAICQLLLQSRPDSHICYLSCDQFMNQFLDCVQAGNMNDFRHRYRHVDLLVIDDIHFLTNRERTQEEFFHTFNELYHRQRQIVLSSDSPPSEIPALEERLVSRFKWGLVAAVSKPCYETRVAIVRAKTRLRGLEMPDEVICYIARKIDSNARELEGAITSIQGHVSLSDRAIDMDLAREALGDPVAEVRQAQVTLQRIIDIVTRFYGVKLSDLQSKRRHKSVTEPRQLCMWLTRKRTRFSLEDIGGYFGGRDHTTVMHSIRTIDDRMEQDAAFAAQVDVLDHRIGSSV